MKKLIVFLLTAMLLLTCAGHAESDREKEESVIPFHQANAPFSQCVQNSLYLISTSGL